MKMKSKVIQTTFFCQQEIYKKALRIMEKVRVPTDRIGYIYWTAETFRFVGLCCLIDDLSLSSDEVNVRFKLDSELVLGKELDEGVFWFADIDGDEPKARAERIEHLKNLIKLYENSNNNTCITTR